MKKINILIVYPVDPLGRRVGGIETFIKNFIISAPDNIDIELVGISSDNRERPVGKWQELSLSGRTFKFLPVLYVEDENRMARVPLAIKYTWALKQHQKSINVEGRILEFHRIEPSMVFNRLKNPRVFFNHANMLDFDNPLCEVRWAKFPRLYFFLEKKLISKMSHVYIVREDGVDFYRQKYPDINISFLPTMVDNTLFAPWPDAQKQKERQAYLNAIDMDSDISLVLFCGRLETQKDPLLLINMFSHVVKTGKKICLLVVGEGSMKEKVQQQIALKGIENQVFLLGAQHREKVAKFMNICDLFVLTSAFEGMPIALLEALSSGLPVVTTDVGEVRRVVKEGVAGYVVQQRTPEAIAQAVTTLLEKQDKPDSKRIAETVKQFYALNVLEKIYNDHLSYRTR